MSAETKPARPCHCGCGRSLEGMQDTAKWSRACKPANNRAKHRDSESRRRERSLVRSAHVDGKRHQVRNNSTSSSPSEMRQAVVRCKVCGGMPWARVSTRASKDGGGFYDSVVDETGKCRGCGLPYEAEKIGRQSVLGSSAGTAASHGRLYGR